MLTIRETVWRRRVIWEISVLYAVFGGSTVYYTGQVLLSGGAYITSGWRGAGGADTDHKQTR